MKIIEIEKEYCQVSILVDHITRIIENKDRDKITIISNERGETTIDVGDKCHYIYCEILSFMTKESKHKLMQINEKSGTGYYYVNLNNSLPDAVF